MSPEELIENKSYSELSASELVIVGELASSEEEFNQLKSFFSQIGTLVTDKQVAPSAELKGSLDSIFQAKFPGITQPWVAPELPKAAKVVPLYNRPVFRVAAVLLLCSIAVPFFFTDKFEPNKSEQLATNSSPKSDLSKEKEEEVMASKQVENTNISVSELSNNTSRNTFKKGELNVNEVNSRQDLYDSEFSMADEVLADTRYKDMGMNADLHPSSKPRLETTQLAVKPLQNSELLEFISPAF